MIKKLLIMKIKSKQNFIFRQCIKKAAILVVAKLADFFTEMLSNE